MLYVLKFDFFTVPLLDATVPLFPLDFAFYLIHLCIVNCIRFFIGLIRLK